MTAARAIGARLSGRLRALDRKRGIDDDRRTARAWLIPVAVLLGTIVAFFTIGEITAAPLYVSLPNGAIIALVMAGLSVACMSPGSPGSPPHDPPEDGDDTPVLGSPGGPWTLVAHLGPSELDGLGAVQASATGESLDGGDQLVHVCLPLRGGDSLRDAVLHVISQQDEADLLEADRSGELG